MNRREFIAGVAASAVVPKVHSAVPTAGPRDIYSDLNAYFAPVVQARDFSGVLLIESGGKQLLRTWGEADFGSATPHTIHTRYAAESISKLFTRAAVLELQATGKLQLSDPLARFIPTFPRASEISIAQLIDHKAGISRDLPLIGAEATKRRSTSEIVEMIARTENGPPGKDTSYSNNGYRLLARVIELAGRGTFDDLLRQLVFDPRGMRDTVFGGSPGQRMANRAVGYIPAAGWGTIGDSPPWDFSNSRGAASYYTSPADLMQFLRTLRFEPKDVENTPGAQTGARFGTKVGHDGFGNGFANLAYIYPGEDTRLVLLGNIQSGLFMSLQKDMRALLAGEIPTPPTIDRTRDLALSERWRDFVGSYALRPGAPLIIRRSGNHLEVSAGEDFHPLICVAPDQFFMRLRYAKLSFPAAPSPIDEVRWEEGGAGYTLKKMT